MKKKLVSVLLCTAMVTGLLAGCGRGDPMIRAEAATEEKRRSPCGALRLDDKHAGKLGAAFRRLQRGK